jgi:hypothetical protein
MAELKRTTIYVTDEIRRKLKKASYLSDKTQTEIITKILDAGLDEYLKNMKETKESE